MMQNESHREGAAGELTRPRSSGLCLFFVALCAPCSLLLSSCASADRTFRKQFSQVDVSLEGTYTDPDSHQTAGGKLTTSFKLRDPSKDGTAK